MAIASVADLRNYMSGVSLSAKQDAAAQMALDGVQEELELYLGRPVQPVQVREVRRADATGDIALTVTPVIRVLSLRPVTATEATEYTTTIVPLADVAEDATRNYDTAPEQSWIAPGGIVVGAAFGYYVVEYVGGYNGWGDKGLKLAILEVASRTMTVNHDDVLSIKDDIAREPANAASIQKGWRDDELKRFDRIRRRTAYR
jgi:hypothetical protein